MNQIQHLECEIAEFKIELEKHHNSIRNLNRLIDNAERKLLDLQRRETLEKYKPQLEGLVDKYIDNEIVEYPYNTKLKLYTYTKGIRCIMDFDAILKLFKSLKDGGYLIYLYCINEHNDLKDEYFISYAAFKEKVEE
jgi:hypothetical protein